MVASRMRHLFLVAFALLFSLQGFSQDDVTYETASNILTLAISKYDNRDFDGAIEYSLKGMDQAQQLDDDVLILNFNSILGNSYLSTKKYRDAANYFLQISITAEQSGSFLTAANGYFALGNTYSDMGAFTNAAQNYNYAHGFFEKAGDSNGRKDALEGTAFNYFFGEDYENATKYFDQLLALGGSNANVAFTANKKIAESFEKMGQPGRAIPHKIAVYDLLKSRNKRVELAQVCDDLANLYIQTRDYSSAMKYAQEAIKFNGSNPSYTTTLAAAHIANGDVATASKHLTEALNLAIINENELSKADIYNYQAQVFYRNGDNSSALNLLGKAEAIANPNNLIDALETNYQFGAEIASEAGNSTMSSTYNAKLTDLRNQKKTAANVTKSRVRSADKIATDYDKQLRLEISQQMSVDLANRKTELESEKKRQQRELLSQQRQLQENEETRTQQENLILQQELQAKERQLQITKLQQETEEEKQAKLEKIKQLEAAEQVKLILEQENRLAAQEIEVAAANRKFFIVGIIGAILVALTMIVAFYRVNKSRKVITEQNQNLEEQQKTIKKRNLQLKRSSEHLQKSNNMLKNAQKNLEDALMEEQKVRAQLENTNKELKDTQVQLIHAEKMSSLGQLTAGIAHEINNPINFVVNSSNIINMNFEEMKEIFQALMEVRDSEPQEVKDLVQRIDPEELDESLEIVAEMLQNLNYGADRVTEIVKGLRTFSRFDEAEIKIVDLHENLDSSLLILNNKYKDMQLEIVKEFDKDLPEIECYPGQLNQVFVNIINNAIDAIGTTEQPGKITIGTKTLSDDKITISISDTGNGIPKENLEKIFDPFFTTKDVGSGTGLGLSISHSIIEQHAGEINVNSEVGKGTEFVITLYKSLFSAKQTGEVQEEVASN